MPQLRTPRVRSSFSSRGRISANRAAASHRTSRRHGTKPPPMSCCQAARALAQCRRQGLRQPRPTDFAQGQHGADDEADQHVRDPDSGFPADRLDLAGMFAQPLHDGRLGAVDAVGQGAKQPVRHRLAGIFEDGGHLLCEGGKAAGIASDEGDDRYCARHRGADDQGRQESNRDLFCAQARQPSFQQRGSQVYQLVHEQSGQQHRQQVQLEHQNQGQQGK